MSLCRKVGDVKADSVGDAWRRADVEAGRDAEVGGLGEEEEDVAVRDVADGRRRLEVWCAASCVCDGGDGEGAVGGVGEGDVGHEPVEEGEAGVVARHVLVDHKEDSAVAGGAQGCCDGWWVCGFYKDGVRRRLLDRRVWSRYLDEE